MFWWGFACNCFTVRWRKCDHEFKARSGILRRNHTTVTQQLYLHPDEPPFWPQGFLTAARQRMNKLCGLHAWSNIVADFSKWFKCFLVIALQTYHCSFKKRPVLALHNCCELFKKVPNSLQNLFTNVIFKILCLIDTEDSHDRFKKLS